MTDMVTHIRARISAGALDKAIRFFNAGFEAIFNELLQNARRASATRVEIIEEPDHIIVRDDGVGMRNPETLLSFGKSGWEGETARLEDPAGMGFWSLSRRGCEIWSMPEGALSGWHAKITPKAFQGRESIAVKTLDDERQGTGISFPKKDGGEMSVRPLLEKVAGFYPIPVFYGSHPDDPIEIVRSDFLEKAVRIETFDGGRIGVIPNGRWRDTIAANFFGLTLSPSTPDVHETFNAGSYHAAFDFTGGAGLELVLPARKEMVLNDAWRELLKAGERAIYRHIASCKDHSLAYKDYCRAHELGVDLPQARDWLRPFSPPTAQDNWAGLDKLEPVKDGAVVIAVNESPLIMQCLSRALDGGAFSHLYQEHAAYEGYRWYDALAKIIEVRWTLIDGDSELVLLDLEGAHASIGGVSFDGLTDKDWADWARPDRIVANLVIEQDGARRSLDIDTDLILIGEGYDAEEVLPIITKTALTDRALDPDDLSTLIVDSYFSPSDDAEANSYQTQRRDYEIAAYARACEVLIGKEAGLIAFIRDHAAEHVRWTCPSDRRVVIVIDNYKVDVAFAEPLIEVAAADKTVAPPPGA